MKRRPLLPLAVGFAIGTALPSRATPVLGAALVPLVAFPTFAPLGLLGVGLLAARLTDPGPPAAGQQEIVEGRIENVPDRLEERARFLLRDGAGRLLEAIAPEPAWSLAIGDRIRAEVRLEPPQGRLNPSSPDRAAMARAKGIAFQAYAWEPPVRIAPPSPLAALEAARDRFAKAAAAALPAREAALVRAIGSGDQSAIDPQTLDAFARSGLAHILSVSGLHLALVAFGVYRLVRALANRWERVAVRLDPRRIAALVAVPVTVLYALGTGAQVPILRSAIAAGAVFLGILLDREGDALNTLSLAALAILAAEPGALLDISFQLSFVSVAGLALLSGRLRRAIPLPSPPGRGLCARGLEWLLRAACASAAATLATAPLVAFHFRRVGLLSVLANLVGVPIGSALTVAAALAALAAGLAPSLAGPLLALCRPLATALLTVNDLVAAPSWSTAGIASPGPWGLAACYGLFIASLGLRRGWRALCWAGAAACLVLPGPARHLAACHRGGLEVVFLSVGQGDSAFLRLPDGSAVLIDAGGEAKGRYDPGAREVVPFLRDAGVRRLAAVFLSHAHPDHLLGLPAVAAAFPIDHFFTNGHRGEEEMVQAAWARLPPPEPLAAGSVFSRAGVRFEVLSPPAKSDDLLENNASLVLRVTYGETSFLFPGDIEEEGEGLPGLGRVSAVKVPHHGSKASSGPRFVAALRPSWAVISLAHHNRFGFPDPGVVARWVRSGAQVLRTDQGAIRFLSDGRALHRLDAAGAIDLLALWRERTLVRPAGY